MMTITKILMFGICKLCVINNLGKIRNHQIIACYKKKINFIVSFRLKPIFRFTILGMIVSSSTVTFLPQYVLKHSSWYKKLDTFDYRAYPDPKLLIHYNNICFSCIDLSATLDHNIPQNLQLLIFNSTFWTMFLPFCTSLQVVFSKKFLINCSCNIIVPSFVLLLCQLFTFGHNMKYCFNFVVTHSTKTWLGCFIYLVFNILVPIVCPCPAHNAASISAFKSPFLSHFHVSFSYVVSGFYSANIPYIFLFFHNSLFPIILFCLYFFLFTVSLNAIFSAALTPSISGSTDFLTYHPNLFSSILIHPSQLINLFLFISLQRYTLLKSLLECSARCIVINFLVFHSKLFNSLVP